MSPRRWFGSSKGKAETDRAMSSGNHAKGFVDGERRRRESQEIIGGAAGHSGSEDGSSAPLNWYTPQGGHAHTLVGGGASSSRGNVYQSDLRTGQQLQSAVFTADVAAVALAIVLLVLLAFVMFPAISGRRHPASAGNPNRRVWVDTNSGYYFCPADKPYGKGQGRYMTQRDAQLRAFKPALRAPCE